MKGSKRRNTKESKSRNGFGERRSRGKNSLLKRKKKSRTWMLRRLPRLLRILPSMKTPSQNKNATSKASFYIRFFNC